MRFLILSACLTASVLAQEAATGAISGVITDPDGRPAQRIAIQAVNIATKLVYRATSSNAGEYFVTQLPAGVYQLVAQVSPVAYQPFVRENLRIAPGQTVKVDIRLEEGIALNTLGDGRDFSAARAALPRVSPPAGTTPRMQDGKPDLSGFWVAGGPSDLGRPEFEAWAEALYKKHLAEDLKDAPTAHCWPSGLVWAATMATPQKAVHSQRLLVMFAEGQLPRQIFLDGRGHPSDLNPTWLGHSVGHWEDDTLVVDTVGFNDKTWLDMSGHPHTDMMHVVERYRRPDLGHLELDLTVEDPKTLKQPWVIKRTYVLNPNDDVMEYVCTENEQDAKHVFGK